MVGIEDEWGRRRLQRRKQGNQSGGVGLVVPVRLCVVGCVAQKGVHDGRGRRASVVVGRWRDADRMESGQT